jgi:Papain family cysteine protease
MDNAFKFDEKSGGLCSEADYPYHAKQGKTCLTNCTDVPGSIVKTFLDVPPGSAKHLVAAITLQPISVAIQADQVCSFELASAFCVLAAPPTTYVCTYMASLALPCVHSCSLFFNSTRRELSRTTHAEQKVTLITESWVRVAITFCHGVGWGEVI